MGVAKILQNPVSDFLLQRTWLKLPLISGSCVGKEGLLYVCICTVLGFLGVFLNLICYTIELFELHKTSKRYSSLLLSVTHVNHIHFYAMQADTSKKVTVTC